MQAVLRGGGDTSLVVPVEGDNRVVGGRPGCCRGSDGVVPQEACGQPGSRPAQSGNAKQAAPAQPGSRRRLFTAA